MEGMTAVGGMPCLRAGRAFSSPVRGLPSGTEMTAIELVKPLIAIELVSAGKTSGKD
jgi:hypothetical protein